jgi:bacterioferritin-associated ferredoxin
MIICLCHRISDRDIEREIRNGCASFDTLQRDTHVGTGCGACHEHARDIFATVMPCHLARIVVPAHLHGGAHA